MALRDCIDEIRRAAARDDMTDDEALAILEAVENRRRAAEAARAALSAEAQYRAAAADLGAAARAAAAIEKRNAYLNLVRRIDRRGFYESAPAVGKTPGFLIGLEAKG